MDIRGTPPGPRGAPAYTIIEIAVVAAVVALLLAIGVPTLRGYRVRSQLEGAAHQVVSDLRTAQATAIAQREQVDVVLTVAPGGTVTGYAVQSGPDILLATSFPPGVHATSAWPPSDTGALDVAFARDGRVGSRDSSEARSALCLDDSGGGAARFDIAVVPDTGAVTLTQDAGVCR